MPHNHFPMSPNDSVFQKPLCPQRSRVSLLLTRRPLTCAALRSLTQVTAALRLSAHPTTRTAPPWGICQLSLSLSPSVREIEFKSRSQTYGLFFTDIQSAPLCSLLVSLNPTLLLQLPKTNSSVLRAWNLCVLV